MNCRNHPTQPSTTRCDKCNQFFCNLCVTRLSNGMFYCFDCYKNSLIENINLLKRMIRSNIISVVVTTLTYFIGVILLINGFNNSQLFSMVFIGFLFCGITTGISFFRFGFALHRQSERVFGERYTFEGNSIRRDTGLISKIILFILGCVIGVIITPIKLIRKIIELIMNVKDKKKIEAILVTL